MHFKTRSFSLLFIALIIALVMAVTANAAFAKDKPGKERDQLRRLQRNLEQQQQQKQQIEQEKNELLQKTSQQTTVLNNTVAENKKLESQVLAASRQKQDLQSELKTLRAELQAAQQQLGRTETERNHVSQQTQELAAQLASERKDNSELKAQTVALKANFATAYATEQEAIKSQEACEAKNKHLYLYAKTLVNNYKNASFWHALKENEPFLGFGGVETQNLLQEYKNKIDQERITVN